MGHWKDERDILLGGKDVGRDFRHALTKTGLAEDDFFDIMYMRTYFTDERSSFATYAPKLRVTFVTSRNNVHSPIHAARIYTSLFKHFKNKLKGTSALYVGVQDPISQSEWGKVTVDHVSFHLIFMFKSDTQISGPASYEPSPQNAALAWRKLFGNDDPFLIGNTTNAVSVNQVPATTTTTTPSSGTSTALVTTTQSPASTVETKTELPLPPAPVKQLQTEVPVKADGQTQADYLKSLRSGMRSSLAPGKTEEPPEPEPDGLVGDGPRAAANWRGHIKGAEANRVKDIEDFNTVAVYGSLRNGEGNHGLLHGAQYIGKGRIRGIVFPLGSTIPGAYFPKDGGVGMATSADADRGVVVELYRVPRLMMDELDGLEGYTGNASMSAYERVIRKAKLDAGGEMLTFVYEYGGRMSRSDSFVGDGDWKTYRASVERRHSRR